MTLIKEERNGIKDDGALLSQVFGSGSQLVSVKCFNTSLASSSSSSSLSSSVSSASSNSSAPSLRDEPTWIEYAKYLEDQDGSSLRTTPATDDDFDSPSPVLTEKDRMALNSTHPLSDKLHYVICDLCNKPFLKSIIASHVRECLEQQHRSSEARSQKNNELASNDGKRKDSVRFASSSDKSGNKSGNATNATANSESNGSAKSNGIGGSGGTGGNDGNDNNNNGKSDKPVKTKKEKEKDDKEKDGSKATKKRKADTASEKQPPKKKKKQVLKAAPKPKGPVDVERQCGVPLPNGGFCARSLTCKSHSMGAKRNVPGRSQPYDVLLAAYQKKNQMKQAALTSSQQLAEDMELANGPVDSDEEVESVMEGVGKAFPLPIEKKVIMPVKMKTHFFRMREMFASAFSRQI
ncbi:SCA7, zinc-binding domain-containing protein [Lipomyces japonicus]|uniref:SCA7, zinc-binding domain-containing protein n=1 Tax=Lipomyces japonicus TaxID=56871 RepID=UPI0034CDACB9